MQFRATTRRLARCTQAGFPRKLPAAERKRWRNSRKNWPKSRSTFVARLDLIKGAARRRKLADPAFSCTDQAGAGRRYYATTGISVHKDGRNESEDLNVAARNALLNMIDYIGETRGYSREQAYALCSVAVNLRISQVVDVPNLVVSAFLPLDIFET
ncbi:MAG TPA: acetamidase/formamidase family protein [Bryobacteraceae bacterium]|nr:acetamidase/formamidase family protein [Bryobacteraceae bacterium]